MRVNDLVLTLQMCEHVQVHPCMCISSVIYQKSCLTHFTEEQRESARHAAFALIRQMPRRTSTDEAYSSDPFDGEQNLVWDNVIPHNLHCRPKTRMC